MKFGESFMTNTPTTNVMKPGAQGFYPKRYHTIDHWRGIAALLVLVFHATAQYRIASGEANLTITITGLFWLGVQVFFVVSGYCIATAVENSFNHSTHQASDYLKRRFRRIFPPYLIWLGLLLALLVIGEKLAPSLIGRDSYGVAQLSPVNWFGNLTLTETWLPGLLGETPLVITRIGWTLCYEVQFYGICFVLMFLSRRYFYRGVTLVSLGVFLLFLFEVPLGLRFKLTGMFLDGRWLQFALGILVFYALTKQTPKFRIIMVGLLLLTSVISLQCLGDYQFGETIDLRTKRILELGVCSAFAALLVVLRSTDHRLCECRPLIPLQQVGVFSYSLYLVHWPVCKVLAGVAWKLGYRSLMQTMLLTVPICLLGSLALGWLFFRFCERPFFNAPTKKTSECAN